ncbi:MAG: ATP-dependent Clp protease adapter ClpS [Neisseriaceae bacterium]|nr:ATP-dependent Clp protease adapter ClpS [Neisseriaceae bacterium]MBR6877284.1 ATP-dependent Clp protease adapter ClpS [Neisseriaceae bacterium]
MTTATQIQEQISLNQQTAKEEVSTPKKYGVFLLNDHYTPMDFVVDILQNVFRLPKTQAVTIMLQVHHEGKGLCGRYTKDVAQTKQQQVLNAAVNAGHPLMCVVEELV